MPATQDPPKKHGSGSAKKNAQRARAVDWRPVYLATLAETGVYSWAYHAAGCGSGTPWKERQKNPEFAVAESEAMKIASRLFESEAVKRAVHGLRKYKFTATGAPVMDPRTGEQYYESEFSDTVLLRLLSSHIPEVYRERQDVTIGGAVIHGTLAELNAAIANRQAELARVEASIAAEHALEAGPIVDIAE